MGKNIGLFDIRNMGKERKSKVSGVYPELSLKRAREIALDLRYKLKNMVEAEVMQPHFQEVADKKPLT